MDEVIKPKSKAMTNKERNNVKIQFHKRYGAWYYFNYKKFSASLSYKKCWLERFDKQSNRDKQGW